MSLLSRVLILSFFAALVEADMHRNTIELFNIGQLVAFYDTTKLCITDRQFAIAKKVSNDEDCQWKIAADYTPKAIDKKEDLPVKDANGNCYFSCEHEKKDRAEMLIDNYLKEEGIDCKKFDLYTYVEPGWGLAHDAPEYKELDKYAGVYFTYYRYKEHPSQPFGIHIRNHALLRKYGTKGMQALKFTTRVNLEELIGIVEAGKSAGSPKDGIFGAIVGNPYLKKAVKSYLDQNYA